MIPGSVTTTGWTPDGPMGLEEMEEMGRTLGGMNRASPWLLGDWLEYGETWWGDETWSRLAETTGLAFETLRNYQWVASRYPIRTRRAGVSWSVHQTLAGRDDRLDRLAQAEEEGWGTARAREASGKKSGPTRGELVALVEDLLDALAQVEGCDDLVARGHALLAGKALVG